jgi:hypothetical protein
MSIKHEYKTVVTLSTGDLTSGLGRPLAVEIDIPSYSTIKKNGCNFQTVPARQVVYIEH